MVGFIVVFSRLKNKVMDNRVTADFFFRLHHIFQVLNILQFICFNEIKLLNFKQIYNNKIVMSHNFFFFSLNKS